MSLRPEKVGECFLEDKSPEMIHEIMNSSSSGTGGYVCVLESH